MKRQEVRRLLRKWAKIDEEIAALCETIKVIVDEIDAVGELHAQNLDGLPHSSTVGKPTEQAAVKRITLAERYHDRIAEATERIDELELFKDRIEKALIWTSSDEELVVRLKYKGHIGAEKTESNPLTFAEIAAKIGKTERRVKQIEAAAVEVIADHIEK